MPQLIEHSLNFAYPVQRFSLAKAHRNASWFGVISNYAMRLKEHMAFDFCSILQPYLIVTSQSGQLFTESLKRRLNFPKHFVFCEALGYHKQVMLVIVRNHQVYLEARIHEQDLHEELEVLFNSRQKFCVVSSHCSRPIQNILANIPQTSKSYHQEASIIASISHQHQISPLQSCTAFASNLSIISKSCTSLIHVITARLKALLILA